MVVKEGGLERSEQIIKNYVTESNIWKCDSSQVFQTFFKVCFYHYILRDFGILLYVKGLVKGFSFLSNISFVIKML